MPYVRLMTQLERRNMKVVKIEPNEVDGSGYWWVTYKLKTEGNRHFHHSVKAVDEMTAFVKGLENAYHRQVELLDNKIADYETICQSMPNADFSKEIKRLRKLLTDVHKSRGGHEEPR